MTARPKNKPLRDKKYLIWLRGQQCALTGLYGSEIDGIDAMHIGTAGKGIKSPDDEVLPVLHSLHREGHQSGEISMLRKHAPNDVLRAAFRALAREMYRKYKEEIND